MRRVTVFAPATIANLGPGFDTLGVAVSGAGDRVTAVRREGTGVVIEAIEGDEGRLPHEAARNTAGIAARETLRLIGAEREGVALWLQKGLPLGSGLGSSAASAAAALWAVNLLFGRPLEKEALLEAGLAAEAGVSGRHADNVAPALMGGFILVRSCDPLDVNRLPAPRALHFVLVTPAFELPTRRAREALPGHVPLGAHVANGANLAAMVAALYEGRPERLGRAMVDGIVEPARAPLIPAFDEVKQAALEAGALACSISGGGPTLFALATAESAPGIQLAMQEAFRAGAGLDSRARIATVDEGGARVPGPRGTT